MFDVMQSFSAASKITQSNSIQIVLAEPSIEEQEHSARLSQKIRENIASRGGWTGFDEYMQQALYTPGLGYYAAGADKIGASGDFVTAPMLGNQFAQCLARQFSEILENIADRKNRTIVEFGAGTGQLMLDILEALEAQDALPCRYLVIETSADLVQRQQQAVKERRPKYMEMVQWGVQLPDRVNGIIFANELLDAMPVKRFWIDENGEARELGVRGDNGNYDWCLTSRALDQSARQRLAGFNLPGGYRSEICLQAEAWTRTVAEQLESGVLLLVDYGYPRNEFYHPHRTDGTLMCHYRHVAHTDPFYYPGLQDITSHIDFTAVSDAAMDAGAELAGYCTQASFLLSLGLLENHADQYDPGLPTPESVQKSQEIKKLTLPHEMGELFKVAAFSRRYPEPLSGFRMQNLAGKL